MIATLDVMKRAAAAGRYMVVTHESTFYSQDNIDQLNDDPVYRFKTEFIREHKKGVVSFYDHWRRRSPDGIALGMARELRGEKYVDSRFRKSRWARLAQDIQSRLKPRTMRVLGDPQLSFKRVIASWGYH